MNMDDIDNAERDIDMFFEEYLNDEEQTPYDEDNKIWICSNGLEIALEEIELSHLKNIIGWLKKNDLKVHQDILNELEKKEKE
jgi:hypothetical protein